MMSIYVLRVSLCVLCTHASASGFCLATGLTGLRHVQYNSKRRVTASPVTFRVQCETRFGWEVCVTGGCESLGYWDPTKALLLKTDPHRYPIWEGVAQLPGGCDMEYKYLTRKRET